MQNANKNEKCIMKTKKRNGKNLPFGIEEESLEGVLSGNRRRELTSYTD